MIIYVISIDRKTNKLFVMSDKYPLQKISDFDTGEKKADNWNPPGIRWFDDDGRNLDKSKDPDISYISTASSLILTPHTSDIIRPVINEVAELLPVSFNGELWNLLNVYNVIDVLDKKNCEYDIRKNGQVGRLKKLAFRPDKVPHAKLFKIPERRSRIYFAEHHPDDSENNFKNIVEKNKLFGIEFVKVWEN